MRITALARGGLAVFGGHYDPHTDEACLTIRNGETASVTIAYPSAPTDVSKAESGVTGAEPAISGNKVSLTLSDLTDAGYIDILATVDGAIRKTRIRARSQTGVDRYCGNDERV